eukprot:TRINITY_DN3240_c0_g1_i6.p3 TRINITY_DN3240_c0_g1~~TRINITY_DN3240_c0_g1_i6.p3  ORF type:complete len:301 (-),score=27.09 TRINITY_DN3240_c0_g1_i6:506-1408(-)
MGMKERRGPKIGDSSSLWNFTTSPGWSPEEGQLLKLLLMKLGVGRWVQIQETGLLPGKVIQQLYGQTQRLLGQQSLSAYTGLRVNIDKIRADNEKKMDVERKSGLIIWSGPNPTKTMKEQWQKEAQIKYGLSQKELDRVEAQLQQLILRTKDSRSDLQRNLRLQYFENNVLGLKVTELSKEDKIQLLQVLKCKLNNKTQRLVESQQSSKTTQQSDAIQKSNVPIIPIVNPPQRDVLRNIKNQEQFLQQREFEWNPSEMKVTRKKRSARGKIQSTGIKNQKGGIKRRRSDIENFEYGLQEV